MNITNSLNNNHKEKVLGILQSKHNHLQHYYMKMCKGDQLKLYPFIVEGDLECGIKLEKEKLTEQELHILNCIKEYNKEYKVVFFNKNYGFWFLTYNYQWINVRIFKTYHNHIYLTPHPTLFVGTELRYDALVYSCQHDEVNKGIRLLLQDLF